MKEFEKDRLVSIVYTMNSLAIAGHKSTVSMLSHKMDVNEKSLRQSLAKLKSISLVVAQGATKGAHYALTSKALELIDKDQVESYINLNANVKHSAPKLTKIIPASAAKLRTAIATINAVLPEIEAMLDKSSENEKLINRVKQLQELVKDKEETIHNLESANYSLRQELSTYKKKLDSICNMSKL